MRIKVELDPEVVWFIGHRCGRDEVDAFYEALHRIRTQPIQNSEAVADPQVSRYILRFFRFGANIALFEYAPAKDRIRVLECRRVTPRRRPKPRPPDADDAP